MHTQNEVFRNLVFSRKAYDLFKDLGFEDPAVPQSMYIFKPPRIGGRVQAHTDSTYLYNIKNDENGPEVKPKEALLGLWLALEDADLENSCLWYVPGSHNKTDIVEKRYCRVNPDTEDQHTI